MLTCVCDRNECRVNDCLKYAHTCTGADTNVGAARAAPVPSSSVAYTGFSYHPCAPTQRIDGGRGALRALHHHPCATSQLSTAREQHTPPCVDVEPPDFASTSRIDGGQATASAVHAGVSCGASTPGLRFIFASSMRRIDGAQTASCRDDNPHHDRFIITQPSRALVYSTLMFCQWRGFHIFFRLSPRGETISVHWMTINVQYCNTEMYILQTAPSRARVQNCARRANLMSLRLRHCTSSSRAALHAERRRVDAIRAYCVQWRPPSLSPPEAT